MMTANYSQVLYFNFTAYFDTGALKYLYFVITLCLYVFIILSNVFLIVLICVNRSLHEPMYLFLCSLFVNELCGRTGLFPFLLFQILKDTHSFFTLGVMSYDRYVAICHPLQYNTGMTSACVAVLTAFVWFYSVLPTIVMMSLSVPLRLCGNVIDKVYCINFSIVKLACSDTTVNNIYGLTYLFTVILALILLIVYSYMRILKVSVSTCTPHLASLLSFSFGANRTKEGLFIKKDLHIYLMKVMLFCFAFVWTSYLFKKMFAATGKGSNVMTLKR
uniref:G-protein coupled receptors family 1 profile domain-containing protein n=1 Tax=Sphaeramia orbicularis TaxID=375764 RepID=A0A672Z9G2_9TELE